MISFLLLEAFCGLPCDFSTVSFHVLLGQSHHFFHQFWYSLFQKQGHFCCTRVENLVTYEQVRWSNKAFFHTSAYQSILWKIFSAMLQTETLPVLFLWISEDISSVSSYSCSRAFRSFSYLFALPGGILEWSCSPFSLSRELGLTAQSPLSPPG